MVSAGKRGQRRSAASNSNCAEMDGSMALMATEEGAGTGEVVALAGARVGRLLYGFTQVRTQR